LQITIEVNTHIPISRIDPNVVKTKGLRKAFFCGSNTSCRQHIRQHYTTYQERCKEQGINENYRAVPPQILREREAAKKPKKQTNLDDVVIKEKRPAEFSRDKILEAVAKLITCDDQVSQNLILGDSEDVLKEWIVVGSCRQKSL
jgi:hypothetical protein